MKMTTRQARLARAIEDFNKQVNFLDPVHDSGAFRYKKESMEKLLQEQEYRHLLEESRKGNLQWPDGRQADISVWWV